MQPSFHPRLINDPFDDPGLYIPFMFDKRAIIFDLGDIYTLSSKDIIKISHVFITHTHMDHMIGFDRLLRLFLGREKSLYMYGPEGFIKNVEGKLSGYAWNLVQHYKHRFSLHVTEVTTKHLTTKLYMCHERFVPNHPPENRPFHPVLLDESALTVSTIILDHRIPCLGYCIKEHFHVNIKKDAVMDLGLEIGPWLKSFKQALFNNEDPDSAFEVQCGNNGSKTHRFLLGELAERIAIISPGQKVVYIADAVYSEQNADKMIEFARDADHLFIEAAFLTQHKDIADKTYHLTAEQAGKIAGKARAKRFTIFHFSPRYKGSEHLIREEAKAAYVKFYS